MIARESTDARITILRVAGVPVSSLKDLNDELVRSAVNNFVVVEIGDARRGSREITVRIADAEEPVKR